MNYEKIISNKYFLITLLIACVAFQINFISGEFNKTHTEQRTIEGAEYTCNVFSLENQHRAFVGYQALCGTYGFLGNLEPALYVQNNGDIVRI